MNIWAKNVVLILLTFLIKTSYCQPTPPIIKTMYQQSDCVILVTIKEVKTKPLFDSEVRHYSDTIFFEIETSYKGQCKPDIQSIAFSSECLIEDKNSKYPNFIKGNKYFLFLKKGNLIDKYLGFMAYNPFLQGALRQLYLKFHRRKTCIFGLFDRHSW